MSKTEIFEVLVFSLEICCHFQSKSKRSMGHIAHLRKQFNSIIMIIMLIEIRKKHYLIRIEWFFIWTNTNHLHPKMLCGKFGLNWPSSSEEEDFLISSIYFRYFKIIPLEKGWGPSFEQSWLPFTQGCIVPSLVEFGPVGLEKDFLISSLYFCHWVIISPWKRVGSFIWTNLNPLHPRMHCAKFGWNWHSASGEVDF